jgi:hypothetical protein
MTRNTGETIRGYELLWDISGHSGLFYYLESPDGASASVRTWREKDGTAAGWIEGRTCLPGFTYDSWGERAPLTGEEAERIIAASKRIADERNAARSPAPEAVQVAVPAMAEIAAACDAEKTPLTPAISRRPMRECHECGAVVYGDFCTHCHES